MERDEVLSPRHFQRQSHQFDSAFDVARDKIERPDRRRQRTGEWQVRVTVGIELESTRLLHLQNAARHQFVPAVNCVSAHSRGTEQNDEGITEDVLDRRTQQLQRFSIPSQALVDTAVREIRLGDTRYERRTPLIGFDGPGPTRMRQCRTCTIEKHPTTSGVTGRDHCSGLKADELHRLVTRTERSIDAAAIA